MVTACTADDKFMRAALVEARKGLGLTSPNPAVGAVIVKGGRIIARGFHHAAGQPHAEIEALRALPASEMARGATLYVTLEPCSTHGRTPPCTDAIIRHGIGRVIFGATDPNPRHAGRAVALLQQAGIQAGGGVLAEECAALNVAWNCWIATGRPYVIAKWGMSLDGRIGSHPESRWITTPESRADAMQLRARVDAILIGAETLRTDDPQLTVRGIPRARQPWRVVWSRSGNVPAAARLFTDEYQDRSFVLGGASLHEVLGALGRMDVTSVLIEGGGRTLGAAVDNQFVNEVVIYVAPQMLGGPVPAVGGLGANSTLSAFRFRHVEYGRIGDDIKITGSL